MPPSTRKRKQKQANNETTTQEKVRQNSPCKSKKKMTKARSSPAKQSFVAVP